MSNLQIGMTSDETRMLFTEQGLADAIFDVLCATEGGPEEENRDRANEIANVIFLAGTIDKRDLTGPPA